MKRLVSVVVAVAFTLIAMPAQAGPIMPSFSTVPTGWVTDRYQPAGFANVGTFQGRSDVLGIDISSADGYGSRPGGFNSTFYNTQGMQTPTPGGPGDTLSADLYIPADWRDGQNGSRRTDMWGVMVDGSAAVTAYPIVGFTNYDGPGRFQVWDDAVGWVAAAQPVNYDSWNSFDIVFTGARFDFFVNGLLAYSDPTTGGSTAFSAAIMQAYNFSGNDPNLPGAIGGDYRANWSNRVEAVPEPASLTLLGLGAVGVFARRRRNRQTA